MQLVLLGLGYLAFMNLVAFAAFGLDKLAAVRAWWRIPERSLLSLAFLGGWPAAKLGQRYFRHKTQKEPFATRLNRVPLWQGGIVFALVVLFSPAGRRFLETAFR